MNRSRCLGEQLGVDPGSAIELISGEIELVNGTWVEFPKSKCCPYRDATPDLQYHIVQVDLKRCKTMR
jgi:hypothetical protein